MPEIKLQKHIRCVPGDVARYVLIPGDPARAHRIARQLTGARLVAENREYTVLTGSYEGVPVSVCSTGIGGPSTAIAMEELQRVGADTFIRVGSAGARHDSIPIGSAVIVNAAVRAGGTARAYLPDIYPAVASHAVTCALESAARSLGITPRVGCSLSRDAYYQQDEGLNDVLRGVRDLLVSEMECDTVYVVGARRGLRTGAVVGTDSNRYLAVQPPLEELEHLYIGAERQTIAIALAAVAILAKRDAG
ncbi:MAG: nucleoside phosphorylase [Christensenellaceae bacterium]|nr:nucleoside phosphorylase [Christensenellaceae bacterium]MEA5069712.1 nucleoside phosphorylase [Christensenellaceae bacterium]